MKNKIIYMIVGVLAIVASVLQEQGVFSLDKNTLDQKEFGAKGEKQGRLESSTFSVTDKDRAVLANAISQQKNDVQVKGVGKVIKVLKDDNEGSRHQRFLIEINNQQTLLVAHNIDLAPRVKNIAEDDFVEFYGEYEWNNKGGVIHWTHHDPAGRHIGGWIKHDGNTYQ